MTENTDSYSIRKLQGFLVMNPHRLVRRRHLLAVCGIAPDSLHPEETPSVCNRQCYLRKERMQRKEPYDQPGRHCK